MISIASRSTALAINDFSMVGEVRRTAMAIAGRLGFDQTILGHVGIVATEAAGNLSKHAIGGEILIQALEVGSDLILEILALDRGPGFVDFERCLVDGFSTFGSSGNGLGAMKRLSDVFDIYSIRGLGTSTVLRLKYAGAKVSPKPSRLEFGAVSIPVAGEEECGDSWSIRESEDRCSLLVVDGLGHGPQAAEAAREAIRVFGEAESLGPVEILQDTHKALKNTRGAAMAVAEIDFKEGVVHYAGVGNIAGSVIGPVHASVSMVSHNGIVGHTIRKIQVFVYPWNAGSQILMHSDGLATQWNFRRYPGLVQKHPALLAGTLYRDFKRGRDDVTVVALREGSSDHP